MSLLQQEFEQWFMAEYPYESACCDRNFNYSDQPAIAAWAAYQKARASLCVELHDEIGALAMLEEYEHGYNSAIEDCKEAITKTGVRVK